MIPDLVRRIGSFAWEHGHDIYWWRWSARRSLRRAALRDFEPLRLEWSFPWALLSNWRFGFLAVLVTAVTIAEIGALAFPDLMIGPSLPGLHDWLPALWQVQAAVVGFSLAVAIYAYEMLGRRGGVVKDLALAASFPAAVNVGLALLVLTGTAVLRPLGPLPHRWLDGVVIVIAIAWIGILVAATSEAVELNDPRYRVRMRRKVLLPLVEQSRRGRHAAVRSMQILDHEVQRAGGAYEALGVSVSGLQEAQVIRSSRTGSLVDINLGRLRWAIEDSTSRDERLTVGLRLAQRLGRETPVAFSDVPSSRMVLHSVRRSLRTAAARSTASAQIELLSSEAAASMEIDPFVVDAVLQAFEDAIGMDAGVRPANV